jgi:hypothetical protein
MKTPLLLIFFIATNVSIAAESQIKINAKFVELPGDSKIPKDVKTILETPKADILSCPEMTRSSGAKADISVTRDFKLKGKGPYTIGLRCSITPTIDESSVHYNVDSEIIDLAGFAEGSATQAPIFNILKASDIDGNIKFGKTAVIRLGQRIDEQTISEKGKPDKRVPYVKTLVMLLTFTKAQQGAAANP